MFRWVVSVLITTIAENCNFTVHYCVFRETELEKSSSDNSAESYFFLDFWPNMADFLVIHADLSRSLICRNIHVISAKSSAPYLKN